MKFKVGDRARIIGGEHIHGFKIGEIITIKYTDLIFYNMDRKGYGCLTSDGTCFWAGDEELELIESTIVIKENTHVKDFALQVVKYLEDHYGEHNNKAFLEVVNDKLK